METLLDGLLGLPAPLVVVFAALVLAGEPALLAGLVLPSVSTALGLGFLAYSGTLSLPVALATAAVAVLVGDTCGYLIGRRRTGHPAAGDVRRGFVQRRLDGALTRASALLGRHGGRAVFVARWVVGARTLVPRLAGAAGMTPGSFARYSVPAGLLWSGAYVGGGFLAGSSYQQVSAVAGQASLGLVTVAAALVAGILAGRRLGRHPELPAKLIARLAGARPWTGASTALLVVVLTLVGGMLTALVAVAVRAGGVPRLDQPVADALATHSDNALALAAEILLLSTPSYAVVAAAAVVVLLRPVRSRRQQGPIGLLASGGAVVPLVILGIVLNAAEGIARTDHLFAVQHAISTTAVVLATWTVARKRRSRLAKGSAWTFGITVLVLLAGDRVYVGWGTVSSTTAAMLIGLIWAGVFVAAWAAAPTHSAGAAGSGSGTPRTREQTASEHRDRAPAMHQAVVQVGQRLDLGAVLTRRSGPGASSTVQLEHGSDLLALLPKPASGRSGRLNLRAG
ncbi:DedA family protein [Cryptosporangium aurantiacum]|uniref:Undecaprenyl-diphosphatase n=1 Tax=Cryptosporangium aurantiacum TaxID=134849 RepID=A0A1M7RMS6_9ACTN|nr:DedA family protein [Cryptosporangium aurantiacum]SHN47398.1 undecaprenyl-diphosphatase [Cryptosporangium aurantiacum]